MLNKSNLIEQKDGSKILNKACHDYMVATNFAKDYGTQKTEQNNIIKSFCSGKGIFETDKYIITMSETADKLAIDENYLKEQYPEIYRICLRKQVKGYLKLANIKEK